MAMARPLHQRPRAHRADDPGDVPARRAVRGARGRADVRRRPSGDGLAVLIGVAGLGVAWFQWYNSDTIALKAMRAREVTPEEAPELHAMIDRLCALADMPKPRVAIAYTDMPNAFATGRSPEPLGRSA